MIRVVLGYVNVGSSKAESLSSLKLMHYNPKIAQSPAKLKQTIKVQLAGLRKSQSALVTDYSPIARALCTLDTSTEMKMTRKFEIAYAICKEGLAFCKMAPLCELEERHGVNLGSGYKNINVCSEFVSYIANF